jgi:acetyl-CoA C-acetyltransferase
MIEVVIGGYLRTAQSRSRPKDPGRDWLHKFRGDELLALLLPVVTERANVKPEEIDDFLVGSALGVNEQWSYGGRFPIFLANFPESIPAKALDQQCGSSMAGIHVGYMEIVTGNSDVVLVGGMEHMTRVPMELIPAGEGPIVRPPQLLEENQYKHWDIPVAMNMGLTAEKLCDQAGFTREELDQWGLRSHGLAAKAQEEGFFDEEILPIEAEQADGSFMTVDRDQAIRRDASFEGMASLKSAFTERGSITAGNSSPLTTAASAMVLMSKEKAKAKKITPLGTIRSIGFAGVDPTVMGKGPVPATQKALSRLGLTAKHIDYWEVNEAFCVVALNFIKEMGIHESVVNIKGGGTAIGHPLGATGIRLVGTLARILKEQDGRYGCANACCGGGQGVATIIENESYDW